jgi:osmotically-inducible protein OsmY
MRSELLWLAALTLGVAACGDTRESIRGVPGPDVAANADADDTARNVRDRDEAAKTPMAQSSSEQDLEITRQIRQRISAEEAFSTDAANVKVITEDAVVTLRGPVETDREKEVIAAIARDTAGVTRVDDQLEVARR